ncbi:F-box protein skip23 [Rhynchospora pubera]|uniref:F-box protein skip23 n=1 Tax=Rhynchospora pubera TaxID=906938 RepID=A0AAV8F3B5_9POAL|nr:F-box protein skip23 [Rhynchospora pubera]
MALCATLCLNNQTFSETKRSEKPDWSDLPPELIPLISQKIADISDFVRFRVVCKRWRSAVQVSDLAPQLPWIIDEFVSFKKGYLRFYSILSGKTYTIKVPQSTDKSVRGSTYNYLLTCNSQTLECSIFNPLTVEELSLPQAKFQFPSCVPYPEQSSRYVVMSKSPLTEDCTPLFLCQPGDYKWTRINGSLTQSRYRKERGEFFNSGFTFYDGRCYATDLKTGSTKVIDLVTRTMIYVVPLPESELPGGFVYLVASFGGILRVCHYKMYSEETVCYFSVYRLELGHRDGNAIGPCWVEIDNISNQFLFLHDIHGCAFRAEDFPRFAANGIYFSKENSMKKTFELFRYDLKKRKLEVLPAPVTLGHVWFVPSLC